MLGRALFELGKGRFSRCALALTASAALACADERENPRSGRTKEPVAQVARASSVADRADGGKRADRALETLRSEERDLRRRTDFERLQPSSRSLGPNPYALVPLPNSPGRSRGGVLRAVAAGVLRGDSELVLLDADARVVARAPAPVSANALAAVSDGRLFVVGDVEPRVAEYRVRDRRLVSGEDLLVPEALSLRAVAADERALFFVDFWGDRLFSRLLAGGARDARALPARPTCAGPIRLALTRRFLGVVCLFEHALSVLERNDAGEVVRELKRIVHDGPLFGVSMLERGDELYLAAGGVEDRPLDRRDKAFGYVDSFVYLYRIDRARRLERVAALNTSELGLVTPKHVELRPEGERLRLDVMGYASDYALELEWNEHSPGALVARAKSPALPGCSAVVRLGERRLCANPLFDAWLVVDGSSSQVLPARRSDARDPSPAERLGEALFFTTLMAPDATAAGRRSRFTCETCHFEGTTDGRVHHSGREEVRVSTRPLLGLFNNAPHFSRARDRDLTSVSHNEFRVANRGNPIDPWFSLRSERFPWIAALGVTASVLEPLELRRSLLAFLARFSHAENPLAVRRAAPRRFDDEERRGAELFRARCASCHASRLVAQEPESEVPFERWEELVLSAEGPIVWSNAEYAKTGVLPYVDPNGTRVPPLRRLYLKRPYLTNGEARSLDELLEKVRFSGRAFFHSSRGAPRGAVTLAGDDERALNAFVRLL